MDQDWDDDSGYRSAVRRTRITMAFAMVVTVCVIGAGAVTLFGVWLIVDLVDGLAAR